MYDWLHAHYFCGEWEGWALENWFNHTSGVTAVTPTDRPKSVRNRCVIEVFGGVFYVVTFLLDFSVSVGAFVIGLSQISSFFSYPTHLVFVYSLIDRTSSFLYCWSRPIPPVSLVFFYQLLLPLSKVTLTISCPPEFHPQLIMYLSHMFSLTAYFLSFSTSVTQTCFFFVYTGKISSII